MDVENRMEAPVKEYCLGFAFTSIELSKEEVVLIRKNKPAFQKGKLNGVGGKVEGPEIAVHAMCREFFEETGVETAPAEWRHVCTFMFQDEYIHVFTAHHCRFGKCSTTTSEPVVIRPVNSLWCESRMPNLCWLVPMSLGALQNPAGFHPLLVEDFPE